MTRGGGRGYLAICLAGPLAGAAFAGLGLAIISALAARLEPAMLTALRWMLWAGVLDSGFNLLPWGRLDGAGALSTWRGTRARRRALSGLEVTLAARRRRRQAVFERAA